MVGEGACCVGRGKRNCLLVCQRSSVMLMDGRCMFSLVSRLTCVA